MPSCKSASRGSSSVTSRGIATRPTDQKDKQNQGKFVSFKNGALIPKRSAGALGWANIPEPAKVFHWDTAARDYKSASPAEALTKVEVGTWVFMATIKAYIRLGLAKEGHVTGTFVSFKDDLMLLLGKDLPEGEFTKKYGNQLKFPKFAENLRVFESIDGGEYTLAGEPATTLPKLRRHARYRLLWTGRWQLHPHRNRCEAVTPLRNQPPCILFI